MSPLALRILKAVLARRRRFQETGHQPAIGAMADLHRAARPDHDGSDAPDGARHQLVERPLPPLGQRRLPCLRKAGGVGPFEQLIGRFARYADGAAGGGNLSGDRKDLNKRPLPFRCPAIVAVALHGDWSGTRRAVCAIGCVFGFVFHLRGYIRGNPTFQGKLEAALLGGGLSAFILLSRRSRHSRPIKLRLSSCACYSFSKARILSSRLITCKAVVVFAKAYCSAASSSSFALAWLQCRRYQSTWWPTS